MSPTMGGLFGAHVSGQEGTGSLIVSGPVAGGPDILSGGAFGPEAALSAVFVGFAIFVLVMRTVRRRAERVDDAVAGEGRRV